MFRVLSRALSNWSLVLIIQIGLVAVDAQNPNKKISNKSYCKVNKPLKICKQILPAVAAEVTWTNGESRLALGILALRLLLAENKLNQF